MSVWNLSRSYDEGLPPTMLFIHYVAPLCLFGTRLGHIMRGLTHDVIHPLHCFPLSVWNLSRSYNEGFPPTKSFIHYIASACLFGTCLGHMMRGSHPQCYSYNAFPSPHTWLRLRTTWVFPQSALHLLPPTWGLPLQHPPTTYRACPAKMQHRLTYSSGPIQTLPLHTSLRAHTKC